MPKLLFCWAPNSLVALRATSTSQIRPFLWCAPCKDRKMQLSVSHKCFCRWHSYLPLMDIISPWIFRALRDGSRWQLRRLTRMLLTAKACCWFHWMHWRKKTWDVLSLFFTSVVVWGHLNNPASGNPWTQEYRFTATAPLFPLQWFLFWEGSSVRSSWPGCCFLRINHRPVIDFLYILSCCAVGQYYYYYFIILYL